MLKMAEIVSQKSLMSGWLVTSVVFMLAFFPMFYLVGYFFEQYRGVIWGMYKLYKICVMLVVIGVFIWTIIR